MPHFGCPFPGVPIKLDPNVEPQERRLSASESQLNPGLPKPGAMNCPKCRGYVHLQIDQHGPYLCCINCGKHFPITRPVPELRPEPEPVTRESSTEEIRRQGDL